MADLARKFVGWEALRDSYGIQVDGPEIDNLYGDKRVRSGGGEDMPKQVYTIDQRIRELSWHGQLGRGQRYAAAFGRRPNPPSAATPLPGEDTPQGP